MDKPSMQRISDSALLDTSYLVETPEGVELHLVPAGLCSRALAYLIDFGIRAVFLIVVLIALSFAGDVGTGIFLILYFLAEWMYPVYFEVFKDGATPGKKSVGLRVLNDDGTPVGFSTSMLRNLLRSVDFMPVGYFAGIIAMLLNKQYKRLGDLSAGTIVAYRNDIEQAKTNPQSNTQPFVLPKEIQALPFAQQKAIIDFGERSELLSTARQTELAGILSPLLGRTEEDTCDLLKRSADKLIGR